MTLVHVEVFTYTGQMKYNTNL